MKSAPHGWAWISGLSRFPGCGSLCLCSGGWRWILSLWSTMRCPVMNLGVSMGLVWLWAACLLKFRVAFLFFWRMNVWCLVGSLMKVRLSVGMEAFGLAFVYKCSFGVRSSMMVQSFGVEPPASGFWSPCYSSIKTSLSTQHRTQKLSVTSKTTLHSQELYREEGGGRLRWPGGEKGGSKGKRAIEPVIKSLSENEY